MHEKFLGWVDSSICLASSAGCRPGSGSLRKTASRRFERPVMTRSCRRAMPGRAMRAVIAQGLGLAVAVLTGCVGTAVTKGGERVTIEHPVSMAADEVAAQAMQACRQAGRANAAFEAIADKPPRLLLLPAGVPMQSSTYRCTP
jgi:hypothetical protein